MLWIHSIFVVAFILFFLLYVQYTYSGVVDKFDVISSNAYRSVVRMTKEKCSISITLLHVFKRENDLMQKWFSDTLIST